MGLYDQKSPLSLSPLMDVLEDYPHEISMSLLRAFNPVVSVLDGVCGTSPRLGLAVMQNLRASYIGLDSGCTKTAISVRANTSILLEALRARLSRPPMGVGFSAYNVDLLNKGTEFPKTVIAILRFALANAPKADWITILDRLQHHAHRGLILMEYDWSSLASTDRCKGHIELFRQQALELMKILGINPCAGQEIEKVARSMFADVQNQQFQRPPGSYLNELVAHCILFNDIAKRKGMQQRSDKFLELQSLFETFLEMNHPIVFTPPKICAVVVKFSTHI